MKAKGKQQMSQLALAEKHGYDGQDMTLESIPKEERSAKLGEAGYNPMNEDTRRRKWASPFHKNIVRAWWKDKEKHKHRIIASEEYIKHAEMLGTGYSFNGYTDTPPPTFYEPKATANEARMKAARWFAKMQIAMGPGHAKRLERAILEQKTIREIYILENPLGKKSKDTSYRHGMRNLNHTFDLLADFVKDYTE